MNAVSAETTLQRKDFSMLFAERNRSALTSQSPLHPVACALALLFSVVFVTSPASAGIVAPDYDFQWSTIGDVGNAAYGGSPSGTLAGRGSVGYRYRLSTTEVRVDQWSEFVNAYAPYIEDPFQAILPPFTGEFVERELDGSYSFNPAYTKHPTNMSWRMAARYVNWLHNDKALNREAFESGVYDTSTFTSNPDGTVNDQLTHSPDAKFWIPTLDEWMKGAYFDPNKNGSGNAGWWNYPGQFDDVLPNGLPGVGLTNAGMVDFFSDTSSIFDVGQYPDGASPYGLLDTSGGMSEWTEELGFSSHRISKGSSFYHSDISYWLDDRIFDLTGNASFSTTFEGLRIASVVPAPGALGLLGIAGMLSRPRRKRRKERRGYQGVESFFSFCIPAPVLAGLLFAAILVMPKPARADIVIPDYDFQWATIGDVGNVAWNAIPTSPRAGRGRVDYVYRMTQTEITVSQWAEFVNAYLPFAGDEISGFGIFNLTGDWIQIENQPDGSSRALIVGGADNYAANMSWRHAARYANWLHNNKANTREAFQNGAYDISTFTQNDDFSRNDQSTHSPGARFWIPTLDEWMKAGYYDPNLNGGAGDWWLHPGMSTVPLQIGLPGLGGQTNAARGDYFAATGILLPMDVGSYPDVQSPWGLLDVSGGQREWTEEWGIFGNFTRLAMGSNLRSSLQFGYEFDDLITGGIGLNPDFTLFEGLRLASTVPAPSTAIILGLSIVSVFYSPRRRSR